MIVGIVSEDGSLVRPALTDYLWQMFRTPSAGPRSRRVTVFGSQNAMRIWLNLQANNYRLTTTDVIAPCKPRTPRFPPASSVVILHPLDSSSMPP